MGKPAIAIIPARGGSKRIPRKNLAPLGGVPLLAWAVTTARRAVGGGNVWVSSEDDEILEVAVRWGAAAIRRPRELSEDHVPDFPVFRHAWLHITAGSSPDVPAVWLRPTAPLVDPGDIRLALYTFEEVPWADALRTVRPVADHPAKMVRALAHPRSSLPILQPYLPGRQGAESSDRLEPLWVGSGMFRVVRPDRVLAVGSLSGEICLGWQADGARTLDIDTVDDLVVAERRIAELGIAPPELPR